MERSRRGLTGNTLRSIASILAAVIVVLTTWWPALADATPPGFKPWWVQSFAPVHLWSAPNDPSVDYGMKPQWSYFLVVAPQTGPRLFVFVPDTQNYAYVVAALVGPSGPPPKPIAAKSSASDSIVSSTFDGQPGHFGVAIRNLKTGETSILNGDEFFPSASLYKLAVMCEVFRQQQVGSLTFGDVLTIQPSDLKEQNAEDGFAVGDTITIQQALTDMIDLSNNVTAYALAERVGWEQVNNTMGNLGLNFTRVPAGTWQTQVTDWRKQESSTSPSDMLAFFQALYNHQLVSPQASDGMLKLLLAQRINDRIPADLPPGTQVAHKTGNLPSIVNDAGIVYGPDANFIVVVLTEDADDGFATSAIGQLTRRLYDAYN